ncbi:uncharacterized protein MYCFIDRAFT_211516 [Pseudocercospora fijiensis CIRAD86]|uniref:Uncharacterized protein n=1 Tax=Pseudocercospora fijiensis (strain CIRAD86) TaxID=383855 RepID=M2YW88_PSEFD|nr:uncharacterized protein MYCFIDRAFT_211516 [Pseudocercospora fijiensis CIRAD86]EME81990.1 hypothetical protein MYCFIDRAFT_211516 [Pseudocercospora fijiensis CIRAD86]
MSRNKRRLRSGEMEHGYLSAYDACRYCKLLKDTRQKEKESMKRDRARKQEKHDARARAESCRAKKPRFQVVLKKPSGISERQSVHAGFKGLLSCF